MKLRHLLAFLLVLTAVIALNASRVWATNASVSYAQTCDTATVTFHSTWDGGTIHGTVLGPSPEIAFNVPPLATTKVTFKIIPTPLKVTVSSSNGHLVGTLTHTFTADGCGTTTTIPPTTAPGIVPGPTSEVPTSNTPTTSVVPDAATSTSVPPPTPTVTGPPTSSSTSPAPTAGLVHSPVSGLPAACLKAPCHHVLSIPEPDTGHLDTRAALVAFVAALFVAGTIIVSLRRR